LTRTMLLYLALAPTEPYTRKDARMTEPSNPPILLCFDGLDDAANAIVAAGRLLGPRPAVVITVLEPVKLWSPSDPATILDAPIGKLLSKRLELDASAVVLGARGLTRMQSALLGSVSSRVSAHAGRPVLIIHQSRRSNEPDHDSESSPVPVSR
jgi:Universal stress protein family